MCSIKSSQPIKPLLSPDIFIFLNNLLHLMNIYVHKKMMKQYIITEINQDTRLITPNVQNQQNIF